MDLGSESDISDIDLGPDGIRDTVLSFVERSIGIADMNISQI